MESFTKEKNFFELIKITASLNFLNIFKDKYIKINNNHFFNEHKNFSEILEIILLNNTTSHVKHINTLFIYDLDYNEGNFDKGIIKMLDFFNLQAETLSNCSKIFKGGKKFQSI